VQKVGHSVDQSPQNSKAADLLI